MKEDLNNPLDIETERKLLGEALYNIQDQLPSLVIEGEEDKWIEHFKYAHNVFNQFGSDITSLFAELCVLYEIQNEEDIKDENKNAIRVSYLIIRGLLSHAMIQAQYNIDILQTSIDNEDVVRITEINGSAYYFIPIVLNNVFTYYNMLLSFMLVRIYFNEEFILSIRERLLYLISTDFEDMRRNFKVAECWEVKRKSEENKITLH
jgi:hypothetical protein